MNQEQDTLERIRNAFRTFCRGERVEGRAQLFAIWEELGPEGDIFHRTVVAHYLADSEDDPSGELEWDLRALEVANELTDDVAESYPSTPAVRAFLPSLHLNLADDYRRMGVFEKARLHADLGSELSRGLGIDAYSQTVRAGLARVDTQIEARDQGPAIVFDLD